MSTTQFTCTSCGRHFTFERPSGFCGGTGYATDDKGKKVCYECCGYIDLDWMDKHGKTALYLIMEKPGKAKLTNWPGTVSFPCLWVTTGRHNIAGKRYDVRFKGPDGHYWHGVQYGDTAQICHCKRLKDKWSAPIGSNV